MILLSSLPRILLGAGVWILFCLGLQDVVPIAWIWGAFPLALVIGWTLGKMRVRAIPAIVLMVLLPWLLRGIIFIVAVVIKQDFQVYWDRGWLLTAPLWYFIALSHYFVPRSPGFGYVETLVFAVLGGFLLTTTLDTVRTLSGPQVDGFRLLIAAIFFIVTVLCFYTIHGRIRDKPRGVFLPSRMIYVSSLTLFVVLLILAGNRVRREESVNAGGGVLSSGLFRFDFGEFLSLEPQIELNTELTMLYREDGIPQVRYLRRFTLSDWSAEVGFFRNSAMESDYPGGPLLPVAVPPGLREWSAPPSEAANWVKQEYYLVALEPESLFALNSPFRIEPWSIWDDASFVRAYSVDSMVPYAEAGESPDTSSDSLPEEYRQYLLKGGDDPWYMKFAEDIIGEQTGVWNKAAAIEDWLLSHYHYSLNPGLAPDGNQLAWFLTETKRGYCSYFAFAMTRLCRATGIPARVAVGFLTDPGTSVLGFMPVHSDQAHAWVEVWVENIGWLTFDPTSFTMAPGEEYPMRFISPDEWLPLIEEVLTRHGEVSVAIEEFDEEAEVQTVWWQNWMDDVRAQPAIAVMVLFFLAVLLFIPGRVFPGVIDLWNSLSPDFRCSVKGRWRRFARCLIRAGERVRTDETVLEWARRIKDIDSFGEWTKVYLKAEFSSHFESQDGLEADMFAKKAIDSWKKMGWKRHMRGLLSPGWKSGLPWRKQR